MHRLLLLICLPFLLAGCAAPAFLAEFASGGPKIEKKYALPDQATLVLVDDPRGVLGGYAMPGIVANNANYHLERNRKKALPTGRLIPVEEVHALQEKLGEEAFANAPADQVGRLLGADQVIHVHIANAAVEYAAQVYRPRAAASVRVIDAAQSRRLWPESGKLVDSSQTPPPHTMVVEMSYRGTDFGGEGMRAMLFKALAEEIGREVAQLFYDHRGPPAGHTIR